jgi:hypothetical protein
MENANTTQDTEVLRKAGASKLLEISDRTLDDWMRRRIVPFSKLPSGAVRFRRSQLLAFLDMYDVTKGNLDSNQGF